MGNDLPVSPVEIGRIVFRSWEHEWQTDSREAMSVASASRTLPEKVTQPIYQILERWERDLLRSSLPFSPYGLRIRSANNNWMTFANGNYHLVETAYRCLPIRHLCPNWDEILPQPREKRSKYGALKAPMSDTPVNSAYELIWRSAILPEAVSIDDLLRHFSPRYGSPSGSA
jgi:hypothetical protein